MFLFYFILIMGIRTLDLPIKFIMFLFYFILRVGIRTLDLLIKLDKVLPLHCVYNHNCNHILVKEKLFIQTLFIIINSYKMSK